jgi:alkanesulfonate monooxygenase SsuD/methylene tetrahydromethanopterin reductase-like flavin-dependent oxidoreductase (luciferase family)
MRYGIDVPNLDEFHDPRRVAVLARRAEDAGWDGFFVWDHVNREVMHQTADPWVLLTAVALATERIQLGTLVTPVARRRPSTLARQVVSVDQLSGGRLVLGVGLGSTLAAEFGAWGEPTDPTVVAARLDEGLEVLAGLWTGAPFSYAGEQFTVSGVTFQPTPVHGRVPVWVAGVWPNKAPMRRAARWDGVVPLVRAADGGSREPTVDEIRDIAGYVGEHRDGDGPYDVVAVGGTEPGDPGAVEKVAEMAAAGATWWLEGYVPVEGEYEAALRRIEAGPPR